MRRRLIYSSLESYQIHKCPQWPMEQQVEPIRIILSHRSVWEVLETVNSTFRKIRLVSIDGMKMQIQIIRKPKKPVMKYVSKLIETFLEQRSLSGMLLLVLLDTHKMNYMARLFSKCKKDWKMRRFKSWRIRKYMLELIQEMHTTLVGMVQLNWYIIETHRDLLMLLVSQCLTRLELQMRRS